MEMKIKKAACHILAGLAIPETVNRWFLYNRLAILTYHAVITEPMAISDSCFIDAKSFQDQMQYIRKHFSVLPLSEAIDSCLGGRLTSPSVAITFDDGYQNNYDVAFPVLRELGIPATIFLTTGYTDTDDTPWFCRLRYAFANTKKQKMHWDGIRYDLRTPDEKAGTSSSLRARLKEKPFPRLMDELRGIVTELGDAPDRPVPAHSPYRMLSSGAIAEMVDSRQIEFCSHTHNHAILSLLPADEQRKQIGRSVDSVRHLTGQSCRIFSYPNGLASDYNRDTIEILGQRGIRAAVTGIKGGNSTGTPAMELRRYGIGANTDMAVFQVIIHHVVWMLNRMVRP